MSDITKLLEECQSKSSKNVYIKGGIGYGYEDYI